MTRTFCILAALCLLAVAGGEAADAMAQPDGSGAARAAQVSSGARVHLGIASAITERTVYLRRGEIVAFETTELSPGSDPVLTMLAANGIHLATDDNGAGAPAARLRFQAPVRGFYTLIVRARSTSTTGTATLLKNGAPYLRNVRFGGWLISMANLRAKEQLETTRLPNGAGGAQLIYVLGTNGLTISKRARGGGTSGGAKLSLASDLGSRTVVVGVPSTVATGRARLIRNDVAVTGHDPDADGLGTQLERAIGTCSTRDATEAVYGFGCGQIADARDTDGDGINDGWELLGRKYVSGDHREDVPLPLWGADPRHKDLFAEIDFQRRCPADANLRMEAGAATKFAEIYEDRVATLSIARRRAHALSLKNPDFRPGIETHLDIGRPPASPLDATTYGDWGGYTAVAPTGDSSNCSNNGADYTTAWKTSMATARRGIFRYGLGTDTYGGQTGTGFAFKGSIHLGHVLAHEAGHSMGLGHSGPSRITGDVDPNCKPNYPSIMNYAFDGGDYTFADGLSGGALNNAALREWRAVPPENARLLDTLEQHFRYWVDHANGHVDWNRDGRFAPAPTTVRAYANNDPNSECEYTRYNQGSVPGSKSRSTPSVARLGTRVYLFWIHDSKVRYSSSASTWNCPRPSLSACGSWSGARNAVFADARGVGVERLSDSSGQQLLLIARRGDGSLAEARLSLTRSGTERWSAVRAIPGAAHATGAPSVTPAGNPCSTYVAYRGVDGQVRFRLRGCGGGWRPEERAVASDGTPIVMPDYAAPALGRAFLPWRPGVLGLYGAFADANGSLHLYGLDFGTRRWERMTFMDAWPGRIEGRPAMAWVPAGSQARYPGQFYLMAIAHNTSTPEARVVRRAVSYVKVSNTAAGLTKEERVGLNTPFDNSAYYAFGIDLLYDWKIDTNLHSVTTVGINKPGRYETVEFRPKADGINDFSYTDYDDWAYLRLGLCRQVVNPGDLGPNAVRCP